MNDINLDTIERYPSLCIQIYDYPFNQRDTVRRAYMNLGPLQTELSEYPKSGPEGYKCSFQVSWFKLYPWLEYSKTSDSVFCFPCFLFNKPSGPGFYGQTASTIDGFKNRKKVGGKTCVFLNHMGTECTSFHSVLQKSWDDLLNEAQDIQNICEKYIDEERKNNRLRLMAIINSVRWCVFHVVAFRAHNERPGSINKGNFLEMLETITTFNNELKDFFDTAPKHASYTSLLIQKEILNLNSSRVKRLICEEIDGGKFCLVVDEACDESNKEQMYIVLRFVNKDGFNMERFFGLVHVPDTTSQTLKNGIYSVLSHYNHDIKSIRNQGYDGANSMRGQFKGLQALISKDFLYACYVHCFAHRLQLALVAVSQGFIALRKFFTQLSFIINVFAASSKRTNQLRDAQAMS